MKSPIHLIYSDESSITLYPERWGIITSLQLGWTELLFQGMLEETLHDTTKTVKWGIPILFPNAWPLTDEQQQITGYSLAQHGFARNNIWKIIDSPNANQIIQSLDSTNVSDTFGYPFDGMIINTIHLLDSRHCELEYTIQNRSGTDLPISLGLHPYFDIPLGDKSAIEWNFAWGEQIQDEIDIWSSGGTTMLDIPMGGKLDIHIPWVGDISLLVSPDFQRVWIWSLPGKDFVCIEPVMGDPGNILDNPVLVPPYSEHKYWMKVWLQI